MKKFSWIASLVLAGGLLVGCQSDDDYYYENTDPVDRGRAGRLTPSDRMEMDTQRDPYPVIKGDTTGDGMRRDRRGGGAITGDDVTPGERLDGTRPTPTPPPDNPASSDVPDSSITTTPGQGGATGTSVGPARNAGGGTNDVGVPMPNTGGGTNR